jgi:hypothetical protein
MKLQKNNRANTTKKLKHTSRNPPQMDNNPVMRRKIRYIASSGGTANITTGNVMSSLGVVATNSTTAFATASFYRIRSIEMWGDSADTAGTSNSVEVIWYPFSAIGKPSIFTDTSNSSAVSPHLYCKPPKNTLSGDWIHGQANYNTVLFQLTFSAATVVDFDVEFLTETRYGGNTSNASFVAGNSLTTGYTYWSDLDGAGGKLVPVNLPVM